MKNYEQWEITKNPPEQLDGADLLRYCAQVGTLAPSTHNTQPWKCTIDGESIIVGPDFSKQLPHGDPIDRGVYISLGCFITNMRCAAAHYGKGLEADQILKDDVLSVRFALRELKVDEKVYFNLFTVVADRVSDKSEYSKTALPIEVRALLEARLGDAITTIITDKSAIYEASRQYVLSAGAMAKSKLFRKELSGWLRHNLTRSHDGMPGFVSNLPLLISIIGPHAMPHLAAAAQLQVKKDARKIASSPAFAVIYSQLNNPENWLEVGELYELIALLAVSNGLAMTPMAGMIEEPSGRAFLSQFNEELLAQFFFRLGYSDVGIPRHTPRRALVFP